MVASDPENKDRKDEEKIRERETLREKLRETKKQKKTKKKRKLLVVDVQASVTPIKL